MVHVMQWRTNSHLRRPPIGRVPARDTATFVGAVLEEPLPFSQIFWKVNKYVAVVIEMHVLQPKCMCYNPAASTMAAHSSPPFVMTTKHLVVFKQRKKLTILSLNIFGPVCLFG